MIKLKKFLTNLQAKHSRLVARGVEIGDERANIAYQAHATGDAKAEKRLAELHREAAEHASVLASLDAAIKTATEKLEKARQAEAQKADRASPPQLFSPSKWKRASSMISRSTSLNLRSSALR